MSDQAENVTTEAKPDRQPRLWTSVKILSFGWGFFTVLFVIPWFGPLSLLVLVPWGITLLFIVVWHYAMRFVYHKSERGPGSIGTTVWLAPAVLISIVILAVPAWDSLPRNRFEQLVVSPIPPTVQNIRVGGQWALLCEYTVLYFEIAPEDFPKLLAPHEYQKGSPGGLDDLAEKYLDIHLRDLEPFDVFEVDLTTEQQESCGTFCTQAIIANKERTKVLFFYMYEG